MQFGMEWNRFLALAGLAAFFAVLAVNLVVPVVMVAVMGLVDRVLMRLWFGPGGAEPEETPA